MNYETIPRDLKHMLLLPDGKEVVELLVQTIEQLFFIFT